MFTKYLLNTLMALVCLILLLFLIGSWSYYREQQKIFDKADKALRQAFQPPTAAELKEQQREMEELDHVVKDMDKLTAHSIEEERASQIRQEEMERRRLREIYP